MVETTNTMGEAGLSYYWLATYRDGSQLEQFDKEGKERLFKEIEQSKLDTFSWVPFDKSKPAHTLKLQPFQRLIAVRRHHLVTKLRTGEKKDKITYLLGWQTTHQGKNIKSIMFIHPDGSITEGGE